MYTVRILATIAEVEALKPAWEALAARVEAAMFTQTCDWALCGHAHPVGGKAPELFCATVWRGDELAGVWAYKIELQGRIRVASALGCGLGEEYAAPLVDAADEKAITRLLWQAIQGGADIVEAGFLRHGSVIQGLIEPDRRLRLQHTDKCFHIAFDDVASWDDYERSLTGNRRSNINRKMRHLAEGGEVTFELPDDPARCDAIIDWVLLQKQAWLKERGISRDWFFGDQAADFMRAAARCRSAGGRLALFSLCLDGVPVASSICTIDKTRVELFIFTFDPAYARVSPGILFIAKIARWCFDHGLAFDFRGGAMPYKEHWANRVEVYSYYRVAATRRGLIAMLPAWLSHNVRSGVKSLLPDDAVARIKALKAGLRGAPKEAEAA